MAHQNYVHPVKTILISKSRFQARSIYFIVFVWIVAAISSATFCQLASAQNAKTYAQKELAEKYRVELAPLDADKDTLASIKKANRPAERNQRDDMGKVRAILTGNGNFADPVIAEYFEGYEFPSMTIVDNRVESLGEKRTKFIKDFLNDKVTGGVRTGLIDLTINSMKKICPDETLHPAARLNAVYLMGMLDQVPAMRNPVQIPVPSRSAFDNLKTILNSQNNSFPPYLKVAALAGIQRHLEIDRLVGGQIPAADKQQLLQTAYGFLDDPKTDDLSYWLKRRGMQLIGLIGNPQSLDRVIAVLNSEDADFWLRFDALEAIGQLNLSADAAKNMEATVAVTRFVGSSLEKESKSIEAAVDKLVFDQLLFQDLDIKATGTNYENTDAAGTGMPSGPDGGRGGGPPGGGKFDGGGMGMGMGAGMGAGGAGGPGMPGAGLGGGGSSEPTGPTLELPVYQLNVIRRKIKALAYTGSQILGGESGTDGLTKLVDADGKAFISKVTQSLKDTLEKSNAGIVDLDARKSDDEPEEENPISVTQKLINLCANSGKTLMGYVRSQTGEPEPAAPADTVVPVDAKPAPATPAAGDKPDF